MFYLYVNGLISSSFPFFLKTPPIYLKENPNYKSLNFSFISFFPFLSLTYLTLYILFLFSRQSPFAIVVITVFHHRCHHILHHWSLLTKSKTHQNLHTWSFQPLLSIFHINFLKKIINLSPKLMAPPPQKIHSRHSKVPQNYHVSPLLILFFHHFNF